MEATLLGSFADKAREVMSALNLNMGMLADVLGVSIQDVYDLLKGKEQKSQIAQRLTAVACLLSRAGVTAQASLSPRFVRESLSDGSTSLLELLRANTLDEVRLANVLAQAKMLEASAEAHRLSREDRLRELGFEEPTAEQRKNNLDNNIALLQRAI